MLDRAGWCSMRSRSIPARHGALARRTVPLLVAGLLGGCGAAINPGPPPTPSPVLVLEAERFAGVSEMPGENYAAAPGWTAYSQPFYSGGRAAITRNTGGTLLAPIPDLPPGDYRVTLFVYDYGSGARNRVSLTLNGVTATVDWGGSEVGVHPIVIDFRSTIGGRELILRAVEREQPYIIVDRIRVEPLR